ncbi:MAG: MarR family transcriptional regulator [Dokdonella sp.]|uniref:MarR family winged helix-turn-helix transcriptional regulator n=1 Tax=Dokdonella sp. TaxID=2291710 RepID=UPI00326522ED
MMTQATDSTFAYLMQDVTRHLRTHFDRRAVRFKLTRAQWRALKAIRRKEGLSQTELADFLDMQPIPVGRVIDRLEKTGYVERRADPGDRRRWSLYLTAKANAVVAEMEIIAKGLRDDALSNVKREDFETLVRVLAQIKDNLVALDGAPNQERAAS